MTEHKKFRIRILRFFIFVVITTILLFGFIVSTSINDGTEQYTGIRKEAAIKALWLDDNISAAAPIPLYFRHRVEKIYPTDPNSSWYQACKGRSENPNNIVHYSARVSHSYFLWPHKYIDYSLCQSDPGSSR